MAESTQPSDSGVLHTADIRGVHVLTLTQPKAFNVLSEGVLTDLQRHIDRIAADTEARVLVIAAEGKAFCAGHDLKQMKANPQLDYYQRLFSQCSKVMLSIQRLPVPVVARVQGLATAAGCQLVAQCDLAVAADGARFGVNGIDVGLFCATPSVPLVRNIGAKMAMEMLLTGGFISAAEAQAQGLVNRVVPLHQLDEAVEALLASILASRARPSPWASSCSTSNANWVLKRLTSWRASRWPATWCWMWRRKACRPSLKSARPPGEIPLTERVWCTG